MILTRTVPPQDIGYLEPWQAFLDNNLFFSVDFDNELRYSSYYKASDGVNSVILEDEAGKYICAYDVLNGYNLNEKPDL